MQQDPHTIIEQYLPGRSFETRANVLLVPTEHVALASTIRRLFENKLPLVTVFATDERKNHPTPHKATEGHSKAFYIHYVFGVPNEEMFIVPRIELAGTASFPSLAREFPSLALYEREIKTMFGLAPEGHPDPRSLILHEENWPQDIYPLRKDFIWNTRTPDTHSGDYRFQKLGGEGIYEIPVGPVHAGIIEPGHFRFSVAGEEIVQLEARLGWVHKGAEKLFETFPIAKSVQLAEHISGDSSFSHSLAFCQALETLTDTPAPKRAQYLRLIFAELERLTMHIFDIGNIAGNGTGFSFMSSQGFRLVEDLRRISESLSDNRFLRSINVPGGVTRDITPEQGITLLKSLAALKKDFTEIITVADASASLINRLKNTGTLSVQVAQDIGALGVGARASGIEKDARIDRPYAAYAKIAPMIAIENTGDVNARFRVRIKEVYESLRLIEEALATIPFGAIHKTLTALPATGLAISAVEGWRGEIAYAVATQDGEISRVKVRDPSFINWQLFPHMITTDMVPDFPLINKSLNLSYTGNDL